MNEALSSVPARATTRHIARPRTGTLRLWTIQPLWTWERLCEQGTLWSDPTDNTFFRDFQDAYDWMRGQMRRRLPEYGGRYPWWAYEHKPDLRRYKPGAGRMVRLELAVPPERVLLSAYGAWHYVLSLWYLPKSVDDAGYAHEENTWKEELERHGLDPYRSHPLPEPWCSRMTVSWERIFDVDDLRPSNTIQACFERLDLADVVRVMFFTPRPRQRSGAGRPWPE